ETGQDAVDGDIEINLRSHHAARPHVANAVPLPLKDRAITYGDARAANSVRPPPPAGVPTPRAAWGPWERLGGGVPWIQRKQRKRPHPPSASALLVEEGSLASPLHHFRLTCDGAFQGR